MPRVGYKNQYLIYDVVNSVSYKKISKAEAKLRFQKMKKKLKKYFDFNLDFELIDFVKGERPIPISDIKDRRSTIIEKKKFFNINYYNIREGKYISAPLITYKLSKKIS
jgi:hypothetical protein